MNIPDGIVELSVVGAITATFKVVFGLIKKNDDQTDKDIDTIKAIITKLDDRSSGNEKELFLRTAQTDAQVVGVKAILDCMKGK